MIIHMLGGQDVYYYVSCKRQFWLYARGIRGEEHFDSMVVGQVVHEDSFSRMKFREIPVGAMKIDFVDKKGVLHETKSSKVEKVQHRYQVLFYLYYLHEVLGLPISSAMIHYPQIKKKVSVSWGEEWKVEIEKMVEEMKAVFEQPLPPDLHPNRKLCNECSYFYVCYAV